MTFENSLFCEDNVIEHNNMSAPADSRGYLEQKAREALAASGKTDLLLRFFDSQFFDEWIALT